MELVKELGRGAFGKVWKGILTKNEVPKPAEDAKDKPNKKPSQTKKKSKVAVKMLRGKINF